MSLVFTCWELFLLVFKGNLMKVLIGALENLQQSQVRKLRACSCGPGDPKVASSSEECPLSSSPEAKHFTFQWELPEMSFLLPLASGFGRAGNEPHYL